MAVWSGWWSSWVRADNRRQAVQVLLAGVVVLGVFLRLNGWLGHTISFWYDEAMWAGRLLRLPLAELGIRPVGFMWLTRLAVRAFGASELWFRLLPAVGAVASLLLVPYVASQLFRSPWLRLLLVTLFALHPALIDYANEFKPYSFEVLIHVVAVALYLRFRQTNDRAWFFALAAYLPIGFLLAYNLAFAFPGLLLLLLLHGYGSGQRIKLVGAALLSGLCCLALSVGIYTWSLKNVTSEKRTERYWGNKYHVFYERGSEQSRVDWTVETFNDLTSFAGLRRKLWDSSSLISERAASELGSLDRLFWSGLSLAGLYALWRQRRDLLVVLAAPILVLVLLNALGKWPFGAFRTNLFMAAYCLPLPVLGLQLLATTRRRGVAFAAAVACLTLVPGFCFGFDWRGHKRMFTRDHYQRQILAKLHQHREAQLAEQPRASRVPLLLDSHTYVPHQFYLTEQPEMRERHAAFFDAHFNVSKAKPRELAKVARRKLQTQKHGVWVVSSSGHYDQLEKELRRVGRVAFHERIRDQHALFFLLPLKNGRKS